jgi:hypothetical protein
VDVKDVKLTLNLTAPIRWPGRVLGFVFRPIFKGIQHVEEDVAKNTVSRVLSTPEGRAAFVDALASAMAAKKE